MFERRDPLSDQALARGETTFKLQSTGFALRDTPPFEHDVNDPQHTPPEQLRTDIYVPLQWHFICRGLP